LLKPLDGASLVFFILGLHRRTGSNLMPRTHPITLCLVLLIVEAGGSALLNKGISGPSNLPKLRS
jgi:hypothetical protein